ncbi:amino acid adenylation domain-containing protein [Streptomyces sp. AK02-01A]|uniref:non-ribosomal peptide synthetase n=1 Tax=Streptomyces sp. AK02-01A TaxID=3028648 RepID=UPI0029BF925F|nr:amino acid adenylation domain-containing protein [Streptomyces sp. AK02-01A]MDX3854760.1 amino acid adenylation domain-containing protein [Streptomyces sp. AK02-01A]
MSDAPAGPHTAIQTRPEARPATAAQSGIWFNELLDDCGAVHHVPFIVSFDGDLDIEALHRACAAVLRRHPSLTSVVEDRSGAPFLIPGSARPELVVERRTGQDSVQATRQHILAPFDLARGPLCRLTLQIVGPREHRLLVVAHHLVFDGRSMELFAADLATFYGAELGGGGHGPAGPPELPPGEPVGAEEKRIAANLPAARRYWAEHPLGGDEVVLPGLDRTARGVRAGESVEFRFPEELRARLGPTAERIGVTRFELIVASVHALLFRYGNSAPVTALDLGTRTPDQRDRVGVYVNELPFTSEPEGGTPFAGFAREIRTALRELYRVRDVPLGRVGAGVKPGVALAPVSLSYRRPTAAPEFPGVAASVDWGPSNHTARNALRLELVDGRDEFSVLLQYPPRSIARAEAESVGRHWLTALGHVTAAPETTLAELSLLGPDERDRTLADWNDTAVAYPGPTVPELVAEQAARTPDATAVIHADRRLTYAELNTAADRLADRLRGKGVGPGALVAVRAKRSERLVVGLLGVLKAGAAYIPLDPGYPAARLEFIAADSKAVLDLGDADLAIDTMSPDGSGEAGESGGPAVAPGPGDLAYVIYTSGSTGRPKGVRIEHHSLTNLLLSFRDLLDAGPAHRWLALTSVSFDISALEIFLPLITGATVVVATEGQTRDGEALRELAARHGVSHIQATPTGWAMLLDAGFDAPAVTALTGGEALPLTLAQRLRPRAGRLLNVYGPTETTIWSTADEVGPDPDRVTIGRPLANTRIRVLDEHLAPVPVGIPGDLFIAGAGVARGYLDRPELDSERFLPDPYGPPGERMYRTGDRVRRRGDGRLEFLGRADDQIKLRGHRIELGEIESRLLAVDGVHRAAAAVRDGRLIGYHTGGADAGALRRELAAALPAYMVPEVFVALDALPATPNGKLDRAALPPPPEAAPAPSAGSETVRETVREIWCEVLGLPGVGDTEDIFDLGGHSITMTQISTRILDRLGVDVPLYAYFEEPTVRGIAEVVDDLRTRM